MPEPGVRVDAFYGMSLWDSPPGSDAWPSASGLIPKGSLFVHSPAARNERVALERFREGLRQGLEQLVGDQPGWARIIDALPPATDCGGDNSCTNLQTAGRWAAWSRLNCSHALPAPEQISELATVTTDLAEVLSGKPATHGLSASFKNWSGQSSTPNGFCNGAERVLILGLKW